MDGLSELIRVAILLIVFGIVLPTFDNYSDIIFSHSLLTGNFEVDCWRCTPKPQPIYGSVMLIPIVVTTLFVIPHWLKREDSTKKRLLTFPLLLGQVWPQWQVIKILKLMKEGNSQWRTEKEKLEREVSSLEPFLESVPQVHIILLVVFAGNAHIDFYNVQTILTFSLSVFSAAFGMTKFMSVGPCRLIPYDKINVGFFLVLLSNASCLVGKGILLPFSLHAPDRMETYVIKVGYWVTLSLLPSLMFAFISMWASIGFKKTIKTITQFPALILTPIFSYWVFGPIESKSCSNLCCRENSRLGLSFFHTWINAGLTIVGQIIFSYLFFDILKQDHTCYCRFPFYAQATTLHVFCVILLLLIQFLSQCNCCKSSCCDEITQRTLLDVKNPNEVIVFEQKEKVLEEQEMENMI